MNPSCQPSSRKPGPCCHRRAVRRPGFTLVELLVVIGIMLVLAALLFPLVGTLQARGQSSQCMANLRQHSAFVQEEVADRGAYPPMLNHFTDSGGGLRHTGDALGILMRDQRFTICPSAKYTGFNKRGQPIGGYGGNPMVLPWIKDSTPPLVRPSQITRPAEVMLMTDGAQFAGGNPRPLQFSARWYGSRTGNPSNADKKLTTAEVKDGGFWDEVSQIPLRHNGTANILFCDGSIRSIKSLGDLKQRNLYWNY